MPPTSVTHGPFDIVARGRAITSGGMFSSTGQPRSTREATDFSVKYKGRTVTVLKSRTASMSAATGKTDEATSSFWRVVRLTDALAPTLLVSTTDFWLITEDNGQLVTRHFDSDVAEYHWLDADNGQPKPPVAFAIEKVDPQTGTELRGGRWLRLKFNVLDVRTLRRYPVRPWIASGSGAPFAGLTAGNTRAIAFSPWQTKYVTYADDSERDGSGARYLALLVVDIPTGNAHAIKLSRQTQRFYDANDLTPAWIDHYFRWTRDSLGSEQLQPRADAKPPTRSGRFNATGADSLEYALQPVRPEIVPALARLLVERMNATPVPDMMRPNDGHRGTTFNVPGCAGIINLYYDRKDKVALYAGATTPAGVTPKDCAQVVRRIGEAFDAELRRGMHQTLLVNE